MQSVRLSIEYTEDTIHPMHAFVCESPAVRRQYLLEGRLDDGTRTLLLHVLGDPDVYEAAMTARERVEEYRIHEDDDEGFFLYVRVPNDSDGKTMLEAVDRETVVVVPPVEFGSDRTMRMTVVGHSEKIQGMIADFPDDVGVDVLTVGPFDGHPGPSPTERQREALATAWRVGYYEVPRDEGIEAVAEQLDCVTSTASTLLRRAERTLVAGVLGREP